MPQLDISQQVERLRRLAGDFEALHSQVNGLAYRPGTDALYKISPLILKVQDLTAQAIRQLPALDVDDSRHTTSADSRSRLQTLASVVSSASLAGTDLANALYANPYQGTGFLGSPVDGAFAAEARYAEAIKVMAEHLAHAAHQLDLCASACHDLANDLTRDLTPAQPPKLSTAQYTALQALAKGWGCMRASHPRGSARIHTGDGTRITLATFQSLVKRGLVHWDTSTPLSRGQDINLTAQGQQALAHHQANKAPDTLPAPAPGSAVATTGMRR